MAGIKITDLNALTTPDPADLYAIVDDVAGSAETKKITLQDAIEVVNALSAITDPAGTDELLIMDDPGGTLAAKKITLANLLLGSSSIIPRARVYQNAHQSIANNTPTALTFNSEDYDTDTIHDTSTNPTRLTATTAGTYAIHGQVEFATNQTGIRGAYIEYNGASYLHIVRHDTSGTDVTRIEIYTQYYLAATDYVELRAVQTSGGALDVRYTANWATYFMMCRIGD